MTPERTEQPDPPANHGLTIKKTTKIIRTSSRMYATQFTTTVPTSSRATQPSKLRQPTRGKASTSRTSLISQTKKRSSKTNVSSNSTKMSVGSTKSTSSAGAAVTRKGKKNRRSSIDFESPVINNNRKKLVQPPNKLVNTEELLCTSCTPEEVNLAVKICAELAKTATQKRTLTSSVRSYRFKVVKEMSASTTHVICGDSQKRTLNKLRALLRGCWILDKSWLFSSLENGGWVDEEPYELVDFSPAVKTMRLDREAFEDDFRSGLFSDIGSIYVCGDVTPSRPELQELVRLGGGSVANVARVAQVIVVGEVDQSKVSKGQDTIYVSQRWILDSVQFHTPMPFLDYQIHA